ncbi:MAG TPA: hypothetical protein PLV83_03630 [Bacilli bacterium]|nr:hypothetical protein [Bacilli bacterium]
MLENLTNQDIIILLFLITLIIIVGVVCIILTVKKDKKEDNEEEVIEKKEPDINMALATNDIPEISEEAPTIDDIINTKVEEPVNEESIEEETNEVEEIENNNESEMSNEFNEETDHSSIEDVLKKLTDDIEKRKYEEIDKYEEEQEENAIISYKELLAQKLVNEQKENPEEEKQVEEYITKTSYVEDEDGLTPVSYEKVELQNTPSENKFSNSEFISPVFGRLESTMEYPTLKKTVETETFTETKVKEDEKETEEFLNTLKEFRKNL